MNTARKHRKVSRHHRNNSTGMLREETEHLGDAVRGMASAASRLKDDQLGVLEEYIREKPVRCVLIAMGAGVLLSKFLFRR